MGKTTINDTTPPETDRARRLLLKAGVYAAPAVLATALTAQNVYASGHGNGNGHGNGDGGGS